MANCNYVDSVIKVAKNEDGYLEKRSNSSLDSKTANAGSSNFTKYGKWFGMNGVYWCAIFISWCFNEAYGKDDGKRLLCGSFSASCETIRQNFIKSGQYHTSNPQKGDVVFFSGSRHSGANHIALCIDVKDRHMITEEGNTSSDSGVIDNGGAVNSKKYSIGYSRILGYGRPKYDKSKSQNTVLNTTKTSSKTKTTKPPTLAKCDSILKRCSEGKQILFLQQDLKYLGFLGANGKTLATDGLFGLNTEYALKSFQKKYKLLADGEYGKNSYNKMKSVLK